MTDKNMSDEREKQFDKKMAKFIPIWKEYNGMIWFIKLEGLYDKFLDFYKDFELKKIDDYKQEARRKARGLVV